jgi:hypothetical protein
MIQEVPLQLYISAIAFAPWRSIIRQTYAEVLRDWFCQRPDVGNYWGAEIVTLAGHADYIWALVFSHDSSQLA